MRQYREISLKRFQVGTVLRLGFLTLRAAFLVGMAVLTAGVTGRASGQDEADASFVAKQQEAKTAYDQKVIPFLQTYCSSCHGQRRFKGNVTFQFALKAPGSANFRKLWLDSVANVQAGDMPPEDADKKPSAEERAAFAAGISSLKYLSPRDPGTFVPRRLNRVEYGNTLAELLGVSPAVAADLPAEVFGAGYLNSLSPLLMERYLAITNMVLSQALAPEGQPPTSAQKRLFGDAVFDSKAPSEEPRRVVERLAKMVYRRPASREEVSVLLQVFDLGKSKNLSQTACFNLVLKAALLSPQFLFITPSSVNAPTEPVVALEDHHLASRLSYFLWSAPPDAELVSLADAEKLHEPETLRGQVRRMLQDRRARALFDGFGAQWLGVDKLPEKTFDAAKFPEMTPALRAAMVEEVRLNFEEILRGNLSLKTFLENETTFLNGPLAAVYGKEYAMEGDLMRPVRLHSARRGGILTMPGILAATSMASRTSPVIRGVWVLEQILGEHVPPAPPNVPSLEKQDKSSVARLTLRQRTELHRSNAVCANCHKLLDPIGFGLENFDAIGRWRDRDDSGVAIDSAGELPGGARFNSPEELKRILAERTGDVCRSLSSKMLAYALCRPLEGYDQIVADQIAEQTAADGYRMQTLVCAIVTSYSFTHRRTQP